MPTLLELVKDLASEAGTLPAESITTVSGLTGYAAKFPRWIKFAYEDIQNAHPNWKWLQAVFLADTVASSNVLPKTSADATRFGNWTCSQEPSEDRFSIYDPDVGVSEEHELQFWPYDAFFRTYLRGAESEETGEPYCFTIAPSGDLLLAPIPDKVYKIRGPYRKSPQYLQADDDVPEMPARFHGIIRDIAQEYLGVYDESWIQLKVWQLQAHPRWTSLANDQLPDLEMPGPLA